MAKADFSILDSLRNSVKSIQEIIYPTLSDVINSNSNVLKEILTERQLFDKGQDSKGSRIKPSYAQTTISIKRKKNQPTDRVTLKDTGDYYSSISFEGKTKTMVITASIGYASFLSKKYGADILGVQNMEFEAFYKKYIEPELSKNIDSIIEKGI